MDNLGIGHLLKEVTMQPPLLKYSKPKLGNHRKRSKLGEGEMELAKVFHMNGGTGDASYAKNSLLQQKGILMTKKITDEAITALYRSHSPETICIADIGCSSGPNTFLGVTGLIKTIHQECKSNGHQSPEFHVFLNDLPSNDFNSVFRSLPAFHEDLKKQNMGGEGFDPPSCFVAGVAGSFYNRIFPSKSLHFVLSSNSLHWLSQVPDGIENNNGNIYATNTSPPNLLKAYYEQYERDFVIFLKYRSDELVKGGRMVLTMAGRKNEERSFNEGSRYLLEPLVRALKDMVAEVNPGINRRRESEFIQYCCILPMSCRSNVYS
ncbi:S-adenosyl-L-methionine:benzoic acid/salicylic acid carboxyl methyltransferase 3-like isoform X2 [Lycium barbarum]|uniref:S-adenosyl-L-methionine:benzoic acid/salicylic acid carboxyl methyltransferase 3-like isoform X2 n=1 Tax=Lycium barbarum TaxID=112863 RepID=UPI00293F733F|nr:S-adenosyl-L-methionine:benzoic acid/salicylic acid carboxyl methyltransferase 3-like isoform X2 [Lycium barbarum]